MRKVNKNILYKYVVLFASVLILIFLCLRSSITREVFYLLLISFAIAYTLKPIQGSIVRTGISCKIAALILICILILIVAITLTILIPSIFKESLSINTTINSMQTIIDRFYSKIRLIRSNKTMYIVTDNAYCKINNYFIGVSTKIFDGALKIGQNIMSIAVIPIISYYFLADGEYLTNKILNLFPVRSRTMIRKISCDIDKILGRYIVSQLLLCGFIGIATFLILLLLHVDFPVVLSVLNAFFNIIPYFGPIFGALPAIFMALVVSPEKAIWTAIWLYGLQQVEGNILSPKVTGDSINMHPLTVIILLIIGGEAAGFVGMILVIPIGVVIKVVYEDLNYYLF
jgi:predicted PurR-regulated permease PerM